MPDATCALYYPNHPTDGRWLRHALLYYDFVATTVPMEYESEVHQWNLPPHLNELRERGQYMSVLDSHNMKDVLSDIAAIGPHFKFARVPFPDIPLVFLADPNIGVVDTETGTRLSFANLLAEAVAKFSEPIAVPSTDNSAAHGQVYSAHPQSGGSHVMVELAYSCLPVPNEHMSLSKILDFKVQYADERLKLQVALDSFRRMLRECEDQEELRVELRACSRQLEDGVTDLRKALGRNALETAGGLVRELLSVEKALVTAACAAVAGSVAGLVGPALVAALSIGTATISFVHRRKELRARSPYAYLYRLCDRR